LLEWKIENYEKPQSGYSLLGSRFELGTSRTQARSLTPEVDLLVLLSELNDVLFIKLTILKPYSSVEVYASIK
jgi:hypothetical protein